MEEKIPLNKRADFFKEINQTNFSRSITVAFLSALINFFLLITDSLEYYLTHHDLNTKLMFWAHLTITCFSSGYALIGFIFRKKIKNHAFFAFSFLAVINLLALIIVAIVQLIHTNISVYFIIMIIIASAYYIRPFIAIIFMSCNYLSMFYIITAFVQDTQMIPPLLSDSAIITIAAFTASATNFAMIIRQYIYRINLEKEKSLKEYEKSENEAKSNFIAKVSHEIRTPINAISGTMELLEHSELQDYQRNYLKIAKASLNNLLSMVNNVLDITKIEAGAMQVELKCFNIYEETDHATEIMKNLALNKDISINLTIDESIPECLHGDNIKMMQIYNNLLYNAVKFTQHGKIDIRVSIKEKEEYFLSLLFEISDTGIGIPDEEVGMLFQRFSQIKGIYSIENKGTGLGLMISKELAELLGGSIGYRNNIPVGSIFFFTVPLQYKKKEI